MSTEWLNFPEAISQFSLFILFIYALYEKSFRKNQKFRYPTYRSPLWLFKEGVLRGNQR